MDFYTKAISFARSGLFSSYCFSPFICMAEHVKLLEAEVSKPLSEVEADWAKCAEEAKLSNRTKVPIFTSILGYTEHKVLLCGNQSTIHRVFVRTLDSEGYYKLGWVLKADVHNCMICARELHKETSLLNMLDWSGKFSEKRHCYACGNIVCSDCSKIGATVVREIAKLGPVNVCTQCSWDQDVVGITSMPTPPSYKVHQKISAATGGSPMKAANHSNKDSSKQNSSLVQGKDIDMSIPRIWKYGDVRVEKITPVFSFEARNKDKTLVYINLCTCPLVPFNLNPDNPQRRANLLAKKNQDLMMVVGEKGISALTEGAFVYDVVIHPAVIPLCTADSTGVLKEKVCAEILRGIRRMGMETEFLLFSYRPSTIVYNQRHFTYAEKLAASGDYEIWSQENKKKAALSPAAIKKKEEVGSFADIEEEEENPLERERLIFSPMPSISAFFHMEQIAVCRNDLKRPPGISDRRWAKYDEIIQVGDGSVYIPNNKRAKKQPPVISYVGTPVLLHETVSDNQLDRFGNKLVTYSATLLPLNGFVIMAPRGGNTSSTNSGGAVGDGKAAVAVSKELVVVNVLHHPFVDDFSRSGILSKPQDELDPLLMLCKKTAKVKNDGVNSRVYNVIVGSSYIVGVDDLTGRRIVTPERITKILRRVNAFFEDTADVQKYVLSGVEKRPVTEAAPLTVFSYERPLFGTIGEIPSAQQQGPSLPASPTAASPGPVPAPTNVVSPKGVPPAASADAKQQQQAPKKNKGGGWLGMSRSRDTRDASDSASVISDITYTDAGVANGSSASRDSYGGDQYGRQSLGPGVVPPSSAGNKKSTAGRYFFGSGTRPGPPSVAGTPAGTPTPMSEPNVTLPSEEHKGEAYGARPLPPPSPVYNRLSLAQPNGTTTGAGAGGIASMDEDSISKRSSTSSIAAVGSGGAADAGAGAGYRNSTGHSISPSRGDGLGLGTARGLTLEVLVAQAKSQSRVRSSQGSRNSDASEDETPMQLQPTKTAPAQRSIFLNQAPTPLHRDASAPHSAAQSPTTSVSTVTPTSNRPPSKDYTARPFSALFFRSTSDKKVGQQGVAPNAAGGPAAASPVISTAPGSAPTGMTQPSATPYSSSSMAPAPSASSGSSAAPMSLASSSASPRTGSGMLAATSPRGGGLGAVKILSRQRAPETMQGKDLVSEDMLEYLVQASVNRAVADNLSKQALKDPKVLFGWQIRVHDHMREAGKGLYVVSAVKRSVIGIYDFRLTNLTKEDQWVKLKRGGQGEGLAFTAVRKVLAVEE